MDDAAPAPDKLPLHSCTGASMFLSTKNYLTEFRRLIEGGTRVSIAVAFWGREADKMIETAWTGQSLRILFNLGNGGTNPTVIRKLVDISARLPGLQLRIADDLHAKVAVSETSAIIGSANCSINGLGLEGAECAGWQEAGVLIEDNAQITHAQEWFDALWTRGDAITEQRLAAAEIQWARNRSSRPKLAKSFSEALDAGQLRNRDIYVEIHQLKASDEAEEAAAEAIKQARRDGVSEVRNSKVDFYENWPDDAEEPLPIGKPIISVYYGPTKRVTITGACLRIPQLDRPFKSASGEKSSVVMVGKLSEVSGFTVTKIDATLLAKRIRPWVKDLFRDEDPGTARCVLLDDFLDWEETQQASL